MASQKHQTSPKILKLKTTSQESTYPAACLPVPKEPSKKVFTRKLGHNFELLSLSFTPTKKHQPKPTKSPGLYQLIVSCRFRSERSGSRGTASKSKRPPGWSENRRCAACLCLVSLVVLGKHEFNECFGFFG